MHQKLHITLFGTAHCHLCEEAENLIQQVANSIPLQLTKVDIIDHAELLEQFQTCIPVLMKADTQNLLYWPFTSEDIFIYLTQA